MALTKCKDCGHQISTKAEACPQCGNPIRIQKVTTRHTSLVTKIITGMLCIAVIMAVIKSCNESSQKDEAAKEEQQRQAGLTGAQRAAESSAASAKAEAGKRAEAILAMAELGTRKLRDSMRDPDSFKLIQVLQMKSAICYKYRARNGFGGMDVDRAVLNLSDGKISGDDATWRPLCAGQAGADITEDMTIYLTH
jgi:hypothetical protein